MSGLANNDLPTDLRDRLTAAGHTVSTDVEAPSLQVVPTPEGMITLALQPDPVLYAAYRLHYFVVPNTEKDSEATTGGHGQVFKRFESSEDVEQAFIEGPIAWIRERLACQPVVLVWAEMKPRPLEGSIQQDTLSRYSRPLSNKQTLGHALIGLYEMMMESQCVALDMLSTISGEFLAWLGVVAYREDGNFYVATDDLAEVFLIHHHAKVQIMVPDPTRLAGILEGIQSHYFDISGYETDYDDPMEAD